MSDVEKCWQDFWAPICSPDGNLDLEQIKKELFDYWNLMDGASKVYDHVTGRKVSKILTKPEIVIELADQHYQDIEWEHRREDDEASEQ